MGLGIRLRRLWRLRLGVLVSLVLAAAAAIWSVQEVSFSPPSMTARSLEMATASTHIVIDTPSSALLDLRQDTYSLEGLRNRAVLLGNVLASTGVQERIAQRARIPVDVLRVQAPLTREQAAPPVDSENARRTTDILKSTDQYRLKLQTNPTVPMLDIYAQAPTAETAAALANAAVDELKAYLSGLATTQRTPSKDQIRLVALGRAHGVVINEGINWQVSLLAFLLTFGVSCSTVIFIARVRAGWKQAKLDEHPAVS